MNMALFKSTLKSNYKLFLIILSVMSLYALIILSMYDPVSMEAWDGLLELFPESMISAMGFSVVEPTLVGYLSGYYYGFLAMAFPMIYLSILGQKVIAKHVDSSAMGFLLSTPNTRVKVALTQGLYVLISVVVLMSSVMFILMAFSAMMFPGSLENAKFVMMNLNLLGLIILISGISFLFSCIADETKTAVLFGSGLPILFFVINMLKDASTKLDFFKYFTIFTLFDSSLAINYELMSFIYMAILYFGGLVLYGLGIYIFNKKDLNI